MSLSLVSLIVCLGDTDFCEIRPLRFFTAEVLPPHHENEAVLQWG